MFLQKSIHSIESFSNLHWQPCEKPTEKHISLYSAVQYLPHTNTHSQKGGS